MAKLAAAGSLRSVRIQSVAFDLVVERPQTYAEEAGSHSAVMCDTRQYVPDDRLFRFPQGLIQLKSDLRVIVTRCVADLFREVGWPNRIGAGEEDQALHQIAQFTNIARPGVVDQELKGP